MLKVLVKIRFGLIVLCFLATSSCAEFKSVFGIQSSSKSQKSTTAKSGGWFKKTKSKKQKNKPPKINSLYIWPVDGILSSKFGPRGKRFHDGIDISAKRRAKVWASRSGEVIHSGRLSGYGNLVVIKHSGNYFTAYGHLSRLMVKNGQKVKQGDIIGLVGKTGRVYAKSNILHFEIRYKMKAIDPLEYLPLPAPNKKTKR